MPASASRTSWDAAETEVPGLQELARRFPEAGAGHPGVPPDAASVLARRAEGVPEVHVAGAADELVRHLAAQPDALSDGSGLMILAYPGAMAIVTGAEAEGMDPHSSLQQ